MKYKSILFVAIALIILGCLKKEKESINILSTNDKAVKFKVNSQNHRTWNISPNIKVDILKVECEKENNFVLFYSEKDTLEFNVKLKDTISFYIVNKSQDSAFTQIIGVPKNVNFTAEYIKKHEDEFIVEIPEVYEMVNILMALSGAGKKDDNMIEKRFSYYNDVQNHFSKYTNATIMDTINKYVSKPYDNDTYMYYYAFKMNAAGFLFDDLNHIIDDNYIRNMGFNNVENPIYKNIELLNEFAEKSDFRSFYSKHNQYYQDLITDYKKQVPLDKMKVWFKKKFNIDYGSYKVIFSPLVGGAHSTQRFEDNGFSQSIMFINAPSNFNNLNTYINSFRLQRAIFTEIDHNYVNIISDELIDEINSSFGNRDLWVLNDPGTSNYQTPIRYFNEYMTWALYSLYLVDYYDINLVEEYLENYKLFMEKKRGFLKFGDFNAKLIELYQVNKNQDMNSLFLNILKWSKEYENKFKK